MLTRNNTLIFTLLTLFITLCATASFAKQNNSTSSSSDTASIDFNEQAHLIFMREEEKLARDVYIMLGNLYPDSSVFGKIDDSEQRHTDSVRDKLMQYGITDPSTNDNIGVFTGEAYGWYFTEKYHELITRGAMSEFDALYVGAFIEELDMRDINQCPGVVVETSDSIADVSECGKVYTQNSDLQRLYENLLEGSENHLAAYVSKIEAIIGQGAYQAQVLTQEQVDSILGR